MMYVKRNGKKIVDTEIGELIWVRPGTQAGGRMWSAYANAPYYQNLYDVYKKPSVYKQAAWDVCQRRCTIMNGHGLKITGSNCSTFSVGFKCTIDPEHEKADVLVYMTKDCWYCIPAPNSY